MPHVGPSRYAALTAIWMMLNPLKLLFFVVTAALEVTLLHFGASLITLAFLGVPALNWFALLLACLVAAWATGRFMQLSEDDEERWINRPLAIVCVLTSLYTLKIQAGGGWNPFVGWSLLWPFSEQGLNTFALLGLLFVQLWAWWRGMALIDHDHGAVVQALQNGVLTLVLLAIVITPLTQVNLGAPPWGPLLASEAVGVIIFGLLSLSLARIVVDEESRPENSWRWFRSSLISALGIVIVGLALLTLVSDAATLAIRSIVVTVVEAVALLMSPLAGLLLRGWAWLVANFGRDVTDPLASPAPSGLSAAYPAPISETEGMIMRVLFTALSLALYVLPLLALLLAIVLLRRQRRATPALDGAVHESLWSRQTLADDLRGLMSGLHLPGAQRLRDALARLRGADPVGRIRRRYVQALLLGEAAGHTRQPPQTPLEYEDELASVAPAAEPAWQTLTELYDRARYAPETIQAADAEAMDAAWAAIQAQSKENR
jgi:hypothetical protein